MKMYLKCFTEKACESILKHDSEVEAVGGVEEHEEGDETRRESNAMLNLEKNQDFKYLKIYIFNRMTN